MATLLEQNIGPCRPPNSADSRPENAMQFWPPPPNGLQKITRTTLS